MKRTLFAVLCLLSAPAVLGQRDEESAALANREWLRRVLVYSYYWYLDDRFFLDLEQAHGLELWVRAVEPPARDSGDKSRYGEVWFEASGLRLKVKKADYAIPEFNLQVLAPSYRVVSGDYEQPGLPQPLSDWSKVTFSRDEVEQSLQQARLLLHLPMPERRAFVLKALQAEIEQSHRESGPQTVYLAARTDVSTSIWAYWLEQRTLFLFSGDFDGVSPDDMERLPLSLRRFSMSENVVASAAERTGVSGAMITREFASRALFLCLTRGECVRLGGDQSPP